MWDPLSVKTTSYGNSDRAVESGTSILVWLHISFARTGFRTNPEHPVGNFELLKISAFQLSNFAGHFDHRDRGTSAAFAKGRGLWPSQSRGPAAFAMGHQLTLRVRERTILFAKGYGVTLRDCEGAFAFAKACDSVLRDRGPMFTAVAMS